MLKNYIKIAFRSLRRNSAYALINVFGLAIGITGAALLLNFVRSEYAFESQHAKADRIVRPYVQDLGAEKPTFYASNPAILAKTLTDEMADVESYTSVSQFFGGQFNYRIDNKRYTERNYLVAEHSFFEIFDFEFIAGSSETALSGPNQVVLTASKAKNLFGITDAIGKTLEFNGLPDFQVTGVIADNVGDTHLEVDILVSPSFPGDRWNQQNTAWGSFGSSSYLLLKEGVDFEDFKLRAEAILEERIPGPLKQRVEFFFQELNDIHFESGNIDRDIAVNKGDKSYTYIFIAISIFLLLIACVNYMNLATSKAVFRAKEIGIRKVVGAVKGQLVVQFLLESLLITSMAMLLSIGMIDLAMPFFNDLTGRSFDFSWSTLLEYLPMLFGLTVLVALISGVYPAFFMTRLKTVNVLKGEKLAGGSFKVRQGLVILQFVLGIFMIISTLVVNDQMNFIQTKNLGFDQENVITIDINNGAVRPVFKTMQNELGQIPGVESVGVASRVPGEWKNINITQVVNRMESGVVDTVEMYYMGFDPNMLETLNLKVEQGDWFSGNDSSDSTKILLNRAAVESLGLEQPLGSVINMGWEGRAKGNYTVIGVLEDFNFKSLHTEIEPIIIGPWNNVNGSIDYFLLKISGDPSSIIDQATLVHEKFDNRTVMEYHFLDDQLALFYQQEKQANVIFKIGAGLTLLVACLGLFGLASFTVQKRVKELGIRKVLGASEWKLFYLLSGSFVKQVLIAFLLASPVAFYFLRNWLDNFQYRVSLGIGAFLISAVLALFVALLTVSYRSIRAAHSNPVDSLRSE
ncbi:ABC transporter permease [Roseivirga sp. E12]|uniref:ABC transporter permease n=1 Tax=Roseivirga sp. E12 TaxID=2819237 RepID=UPI001ABD1951|nr:ABC transporter permease [Roseivirga sp. E12]MBO3697433.1 ABC transporter permease [Roseivirga sp. E12]